MQESKDKDKPILTIFHFNDVYNIQTDLKGQGGICNFKACLDNQRKKFKTQQYLTLFSGDAFSPSTLSMALRGKQMVYSLNALNIDCSCFGNHQFDLQPQQTLSLAKACNFDWLLGNIKYKNNGNLLGDGSAYKTIERNGLKIGLFGIAGSDWIGILPQDYQDQLQFTDEIDHSKRMVKILKQQQQCDIIIALTHMRVPVDQKLAEQVPEIDIVLGGHDHIVYHKQINKIPVFKSGCDFKYFRIINIYSKNFNEKDIWKGRNFNFSNQLISVKAQKQQDFDKNLVQYVKNAMIELQKQNKVIGFTTVPLQIRFFKIRAEETNYGNFVCDLSRLHYNSDACILNSGSIRNDYEVAKGAIRFPVIREFINDLIVVKKVKGYILLKALQKACQCLPNALSGSFLQVSGLKYSYDCSKNSGEKVISVQIAGNKLDLDKQYKVAMQHYISKGGDGFSMFKQCQHLVELTSCLTNIQLLQRFFRASDIKKHENHPFIKNIFANYAIMKTKSESKSFVVGKQKQKKAHHKKYQTFSNYNRDVSQSSQEQKNDLKDVKYKMVDINEQNQVKQSSQELNQSQEQLLLLIPQGLKQKPSISMSYERINQLRTNLTIDENGNSFVCISPIVEGRIKCIKHQFHEFK